MHYEKNYARTANIFGTKINLSFNSFSKNFLNFYQTFIDYFSGLIFSNHISENIVLAVILASWSDCVDMGTKLLFCGGELVLTRRGYLFQVLIQKKLPHFLWSILSFMQALRKHFLTLHSWFFLNRCLQVLADQIQRGCSLRALSLLETNSNHDVGAVMNLRL